MADREPVAPVDVYARISLGLAVASVVTILIPAMPLVLGVGAVVASAYARRLRGRNEPRGVEGTALAVGWLGICLGALMLGFYVYGYEQLRGG